MKTQNPTIELRLSKEADPEVDSLILAVAEWYDDTSGHDVGPKLNKVANAFLKLRYTTGSATEAPERSPIASGMTTGGIELARAEKAHGGHVGAGPLGDPAELDQESIDAFERAGREKLIRETAEAWRVRPAVAEPREILTSGWVQTVKTMSKELLDESGRAFNNYFHKIAAGCSRAAWDKAYCHLASTRASCGAREIFDLALAYEKEDPALASSYDARHWAEDTRPMDQVGGA